MRVFYSTETLPVFRNAVVTVGSYDGLHYGHRVLLDKVKNKAAEIGGESVVVTFWPHPRKVLPAGGRVKLLNSLKEKVCLLSDVGIDNLVVLPFTPEFSGLSSRRFVKDILIGKIGMKHFVVGYNHRFGADRGGDYESLQKISAELGFTVEKVERRDVHEDKVSSTVVRHMIESGMMSDAAEFLTRGYIMIADVRAGNNVTPGDLDKLLPPPGRYSIDIGGESDILTIDNEGVMTLENGIGRDENDILITFITEKD